jgi:hypothetical protein
MHLEPFRKNDLVAANCPFAMIVKKGLGDQ